MLKRDRQPEMPGSRRFPFREPVEGSRWVRYLKEIGSDPSKTPEQELADLIDGFAGVFLRETREAFIAHGATDLDGALAPYINAAVEYQVAIFALGLKELDQRSAPKRAGSPGNSGLYQLVAFFTWQEEQRLLHESGERYQRAKLAKMLGLHPDALSRAILGGGRRALLDLRSKCQPGATDLDAGGWAACQLMRERVREVWPAFRESVKAAH
ncbi:MAG: hypothetical protein U1E06_07920 [Tabrizicola sp.]|uniref:hypothetical protein n=1 Tax=Tabrizicola sp. TaxID=2005166 RepID=UPI002733900F|nr:hypothetical protein [Tabrizicola sp.]MDP3262443.1 hypothetical protein [Tabrizicola sp.]MDP3648537.1 hypothetical protein [Paracoccaceae bacterium]MDZ4066769.1 hypothetical protein [Tabrizicola sp.]